MSPPLPGGQPMRVAPILREIEPSRVHRLAVEGPIVSMRLPCDSGRFGSLEAFEQLLWVFRLAHPHSAARQFLSFDGVRVHAEVELPDLNTTVEQWLKAVSGQGELLARGPRRLALVEGVPFADARRQSEALCASLGRGPWEFRLRDGELGAPGTVALELGAVRQNTG